MTTSEIANTGAALDAGAPIKADDGSIARILGKRPVLWVGAGLSIAAGYPTTDAIIEALVAAADDPIDTTRSFYEVVDAVVASVRAGRVRDVLQRLFQPARPPTPLHRALARLARAGAFAAIVTTNYDDLMERALAAEAAPFVLQPLEDNATVTGDGVRLLKIHGSHDDWAKVVLSGRSYEQFGARNPFLGKQLDVLLRQQPILFVGCSLQDPRILDWLAGLSPDELEGLKEWRAVLTGSSWQTALAHRHRGAEAKTLLAPAGVRPLIVRNHDHARALFVDAAARLPTPAQVVALEIEVTPTGLSAKLPGAPAWTPADLVADAPFMDALRRLRAWDHQPLAVDARGELVGPAAAGAAQIHGLAVQIGQRLSADFLSPAALDRLRHAIGASQAGVPPLLHIRVHATDDAAAQRRGDQILALPWELVVVENQFPVERGKLDVAREVVKAGAEGLKPPERQLSVVAAVSAPRNTSRLDYESECYQLWMAMGAEEKRLHITDDGQLETLTRAMEELQPQVLHFTGHGEPNALLFEDEEARAHKVPVRKLIDRLRISGLPRLAFLASCHGATLPRSAGTSAPDEARDVIMSEQGVGTDVAIRVVNSELAEHDPAWSSAAELHREGVDQVVAWFGPVGDRQCTRAERVFYAALVAGKTARQAVREARQESREPLLPRPEGSEKVVYPLGWAQLALYHRGDDVPTALPASVAPAPARERQRVTHKLGPIRHGVPGIEQLRFGFVGRRSTRAQLLQRVRDGQRLLVISGLGGLGKTALATTMAPIIARRIAAASGAPDALVIALDGRSAGRAADPVRDLWEQVGRGMKDSKPSDARWAALCDGVLADAQKTGLGGHALASVIAWWTAQAPGAVVYLDDAESIMEPVAGAAELGRWRSRDLEDLWDGLCALAVAGGPTAVLISTRYAPQTLPPEAALQAVLPLPPLAPIDLVHLLSWWPVLGRLDPDAKSWVVEKLQGHPRSIEWLDAMLAQKLAAMTAPGAASGPDIDRETLEALFPPLVARIDEDLVLPRLFTILGPAVRAFVQRVGVLSRPAPWTAVLVLEDEPGTALRAQQAGLVSPFEGLGPEPLWGALPLVLDKAGALTPDQHQSSHRRLGRWFRERWEREPAAAAGWAEPAAHHLLAAHEANAAWEPTQRIVTKLRSAGRYREALAWVERVLHCGPSGAERGLALTFDAQLRMLAGDLSPRIEAHLNEALALVLPGDRSFALDELGKFQQQSGRLADAARTLEASVNDAIAVHETEDHPDVASSLHALAIVLEAQGDFAGARDRLEQSLRIKAKVFGTEDHLAVAASLHELAGVLQDQGDLPGARDLLERSLRISAKVLRTEEHPNIATSLHELARVLQAQGDLPGARDLLKQSLRIKAKVLGTEAHPSVAASLHALADVLQAQGDLAGARDRLERVLQIEERVYGTRDHWSSAVTEVSLAEVLLQQGDENDRPRAAELLVHAYHTYQSQLGDDHPRTRALAQLFGKDP